MVERLRDMLGEAGLDGELGVVGADEEGEGGGVDDAVVNKRTRRVSGGSASTS